MTFDSFTCDPQIDEAFNPTEEDWASWDDDQALEDFSLECAFGPND